MSERLTLSESFALSEYSVEIKRYLQEIRRYAHWRYGDEEKESKSSAETRNAG